MESGKGYFGVIIAVGKRIIARVRSSARGGPRSMNLFRAEAYGFLAGICLLRLITKSDPTTDIDTHTDSIHTDSASLLARLLRATAEYVPTGFWLKPDSDIIMQLAEETKTVPELKHIYVKGHQNFKKKRKDFTLTELYNVEADAEATIMRFQMTKPASHVILFIAVPVNVYVQQQLINSSLDSILHEAFTRDGYWAYLETKFQWSPTTRKLIAWTLFYTILNIQPHKQHQQLIKYSVDWLPTGYEVYHHNPLEEHRCPHCKTIFEKNAHLL
jgi:hypothetical protein